MLYRKNLYRWEQWSRLVVGAALIVWGFFFASGLVASYTAAAAGLGLAITGVLGWCPACATVGRRIKD
jgi:hypothetical protein